LQKDLDKLGFNLVGYGCTTCIGNSGPLPEEISKAINDNDLVAAAVLSGNRNFEGRVNADVRANYLASPPLVVGDVIVVGAAHALSFRPPSMANVKGDVRGFDARTGRLLWTFRTIPEPGEPGYETWLDGSAEYTGNAGVWAPMSADPELGLVYLPVESATGDQYGGDRPGANLFANSLVAIDVKTGERRVVEAHALFAMIGATPHTEWLPASVARDEEGYVLTGADLLLAGAESGGRSIWAADRPPYALETSLPGVFAVGDVRHGAIKRVASAVGEGAVAVRNCHQFLAARAALKEAV